jgi:fructose-1,6-bisphosphatase II
MTLIRPPSIVQPLDRAFALEAVRVTEAAAIAAAAQIGRGDEHAADQAAVEAMRLAFNSLPIDGTVVIGEGERDEAPMLFIGEKVGQGGLAIDIALDPLEGTTLTATGGPNALAVIAIAEHGNFLHAPDTYMEKIAVGPKGRGVVHLEASATENLRELSKAMKTAIEDLTVVILNRPRHEDVIREVRETGARIKLISDGDVSGAIATCIPGSGVDLLLGIGGAPEGVIAAAALRCMHGFMQGRLKFRNEGEKARATKMGMKDLSKVHTADELAQGEVMFAATGVTDGDMLRGVRFFSGGAKTHSIVMRSKSGTVRTVEAEHHFDRKPVY